jgi:predicted CXXCH cytochrome family protein
MAARVSCRSCHRSKEISPPGTVIWKASAEICTMCHDASEVNRLRSYHEELRAALPGLESALAGAHKALPSAKLSDDRKAEVAKELDRLQSDLEFLRMGNDIHNIHYASKLEQALLDQITNVCRELKTPGPKVVLPPMEKPK